MRGIGLAAILGAALTCGLQVVAAAGEQVQESTLNAGGHPTQGSVPAAAAFRISLGAIGDPLVQASLGSSSFLLQGGFIGPLRPPGEVRNLRFTSATSLLWDPEASAGLYNLYRSALGTLPGNTGACLAAGLAVPGAADASLPPAVGTGLFYLVTVKNPIGEEGGKGAASTGAPRPNPAPCP
jgi:hypothetical protein